MNTLQRLGLFAAMLALLTSAQITSAQINTNGNLYLNAEVTADTNSDALIKTEVTGASSGMMTASSAPGTGGDLEVVTLTRSDLKGSNSIVLNPADVSTSLEFSAYAQSVMANDENVTKVESNGDAVSIWYKEPAKFLGIVSIMVNTKATVTAGGTVDISYPWWYSLFVKDDSKDELKTGLDTTVGVVARAETASSLSSATQARLLNALRSSMKSHHELNTTAETSAEASSY